MPADGPDTLMLYMGADDARATRDSLLALGYPAATPVVIAENVSLPGMRTRRTTVGALADVALRSGDAPVLLGIGDVFDPQVDATMDVRTARTARRG